MPPSATANDVAVRLGGEFALLRDSEDRHRALLQRAEQLTANAEAALTAERQKSAALQMAATHAVRAAEEAEVAAQRSQCLLNQLQAQALASAVATGALQHEVCALEDTGANASRNAGDLAAALSSTERALEEERERTVRLTCAVDDRDAALEKAATREAQLRRELDEEKQRSRRFAQGRTEKEKQIAVVMSEKNRLSALLSKKDTLARDLSTALKVQERQQAQRDQQLKARQEQRRIARTHAAIAIGDAAASKALPTPEAWVADAEAPPSAAATAAANRALVAPASFVPPRVPGVQSRFEGWRTATGKERDAALRSENAVLLGVLAERDAALRAAETEMRKLRLEHADMLTKWRESSKALRKQQNQPATPSKAGGAAAGADKSPAASTKTAWASSPPMATPPRVPDVRESPA